MVKAGIDLGAHSVRLVIADEGLVYNEPTVAAFNEKGDVLAIGNQALELESCADPKVRVVRPIRENSVDIEALEAMLNDLCYEFRLFRMFQKTALVVCYPSHLEANVIERIRDTLNELGANRLYFDQEIWLAAIGSGVDLFLPVASCILSLGHSNCDLALFRNGRLVEQASSEAFSGQGAAFMIRKWIEKKFRASIDEGQLQNLILTIGGVRLKQNDRTVKLSVADLETGEERDILVSENEIVSVLSPFARSAGLWVSRFLEGLSFEDKADIRERGIIACGGGMQLTGLASQISVLADCPVYVTDDPENTVAKGLEILLDSLDEN